MKIIRYQDRKGNIAHAAQQPDGFALKLTGNIFDSPKLTNEKADMTKLPAPIDPTAIICIDLNYRRPCFHLCGSGQ